MFTCRRFLFADAFTSVGRLLRATIFMFLTMAWLPMHAWSAPQQLAVAAWGNNSYGECDVPPDLTNACFVVAGSSHNLAILSNGTVRDWGGNGYPTPANLSGIKTVDERFSVAFALSSNGTVTAWGANYWGSGCAR